MEEEEEEEEEEMILESFNYFQHENSLNKTQNIL